MNELYQDTSMNKLIYAASCLALADAAWAADSNSDTCTPTATVIRTDYPKFSQEFGIGGSVIVGMKLDAQGKVTVARAIRSSSAALDHATLASARRYWRFDVSKCSSTELAREFSQSVTYRPTRGLTFSGAKDRDASKRIRQATTDSRCSAVRQSHETTIIACRGSTRDHAK